jgi:ketosteroid isomerase-like protein
MSQENVEVAREAFRAWNDGDMDALRAVYHPDAISRPPPDWPEPGPFVGRDAIISQFTDMRETIDDDSLALLTDFRPVADRVLVRFAWKGAGRGPEMNMEISLVYTMRKGLIYEVEFFWDHAEALEAVGLSE